LPIPLRGDRQRTVGGHTPCNLDQDDLPLVNGKDAAMRTLWKTLGRAIVVPALAATMAYGADQTILGQGFLTKNPGPPTRRKVLVKAKEPASPNTIAGDPTATGASLTLTADGGTPSTQTFLLPASHWSGDATRGFKYKDASGTAGAIKLVKIKRTRNGKFLMKALATGKNGTVAVLPPDPGTDACALLLLAGGDSYSVRFGPDSQITNKDGRLFKAKRPATEGSCIATTTSTTTPTTSSTTSTTLYGSPSRAFMERVVTLLE
jgi:hypothetical protein